MKKLIIASTSTLYGNDYLDYLLPALKEAFANIDSLLFIPYARPNGISYDAYTRKVSKTFAKIGIKVQGIHAFQNPRKAINQAKAVFTGGGNTFELLNQLYKNGLVYVLKRAVEKGTPYLGTSAGSNICGPTMMTTNDMPIVYPPSFETLGLIPFLINPHYLDPKPNSTHMGETRETRIKEYHLYNSYPVLGLREGSWLEVINETIILKGNYTARWFEKGKPAVEIETGSVIN